MVTKTEVFFLYAERKEPVTAEASPILEPFEVCSGFAEEFKFHLFKFTNTEDKVSGSDFVSE